MNGKNMNVALALAVIAGWLGAHRFYVGKIYTGILQFVTCGGLGIWVIVDVFLVLSGRFSASDGSQLVRGLPLVPTGRFLSVVLNGLLAISLVGLLVGGVFLIARSAYVMRSEVVSAKVDSYEEFRVDDGRLFLLPVVVHSGDSGEVIRSVVRSGKQYRVFAIDDDVEVLYDGRNSYVLLNTWSAKWGAPVFVVSLSLALIVSWLLVRILQGAFTKRGCPTEKVNPRPNP